MAHTTIMRWVRHYAPELEKRWHQRGLCRRPVMACRRTYVKIKGVWHYLYHAVDRLGGTVDFRLSARRDVAAAKRPSAKRSRAKARHKRSHWMAKRRLTARCVS